MYDIAIIGAGIIGASIARELARYHLRVILLDKESDVANGTTKANSAIIHAGYDPEPGTLKGKLNARGNPMFDALCAELEVPFRRTGSLMVATGEAEGAILETFMARGRQNGIPGLKILSRDSALKREPRLQGHITAALYAPSAGIVDPCLLTIALAENAAENGVHIRLNSAVTSIEQRSTGYLLSLHAGGSIRAMYVINAAGLYADAVHNMASQPTFKIIPNRGQYLLLDQGTGHLVNHILFQCPTGKGKGVVVLPTVHGNLLLGPTAEDAATREDVRTTEEALTYIREQAGKSLKGIPLGEAITSFSGLRAKTSGDDFIIEESKGARGFINVAAIDSPGLTAAPAIAAYVRDLVIDSGGPLSEKKTFNPVRRNPHSSFMALPEEDQQRLIRRDPRYGRIICRCESITEGEVVRAIHSTIGARTLDGVKKRVRAGMGRCQSGFCAPRMMEIMARELKVDPARITKDGGTSFIVTNPTKERHPDGWKRVPSNIEVKPDGQAASQSRGRSMLRDLSMR